MKLLFYLGHPAHFYLFRNIIWYFKRNNHDVHILIKKKDVLEELLKEENLDYINIFPRTRGVSKISIAKTILTRDLRLMKYCLKQKPNLLIGTSVENTHIGKLLNIPSINVNEDDYDAVPLYCQSSYPLANTILAPSTCSTGRWEYKTIHYQGYHELTYLHPQYFTPDINIVKKYIPLDKPYFILRFAKLTAHHDKGINGINSDVAKQIITKLKPEGRVYISSEKKIDPDLEEYRINCNPLNMHHIMAFANLFIGDSQTMSAEAGILGTPFIRCNDFVGKIGYLNELENKYGLGFGIRPNETEKILNTIDYLLHNKHFRKNLYNKRLLMLQQKIDVFKFFTWFIENFPRSKSIMKHTPDYQNQFYNNINKIPFPKIHTNYRKETMYIVEN